MKRFFLSSAGLVVLLTVLLVFGRADETFTTEQLRDKYSTEFSRYLNWRGVEIHVTDQGDGPAFLMVHGFAGSFTNWTPLSEYFTADHRVITVDLPGFGLSEFPELDEEPSYIDLYSDLIGFVIDTLDLDSICVIGSSMGGYVACESAVKFPESINQLVLINSAGFDLDKIGRIFIRLSRTPLFNWLFNKGVPQFLTRKAVENSVAVQVSEKRALVFHELLNRKETISTVARLGGSGQLADTSRFAMINQPTLIIWGELDKVIPVKDAYRFESAIPSSTVVTFNDLGHVPMMEGPLRTANEIKRFLQRSGQP